MIRSMTGYGFASIEYQQKTISFEIKSVNSKFFDLSLRLPAIYREKEIELRSDLARLIERGKAEVSINVESGEALRKNSFNIPLLKSYHDELKKIEKKLEISTPDYMRLLLTMPDVMVSERVIVDDDEWKAVTNAMNAAFKSFQGFRETEGKAMEKDIRQRIDAISNGIKELEKYETPRLEAIRKRLEGSLEEFIQANNIDRNRLEQELIFYIEKLDVSEEKVRLTSHCEYFLRTMKEESASGKKLSFICQELGREINTIGSKANDAEMQKAVVIMKDELEKIKEQVMNVL
jgi:uncharacterized protein (TIGR00255 family)